MFKDNSKSEKAVIVSIRIFIISVLLTAAGLVVLGGVSTYYNTMQWRTNKEAKARALDIIITAQAEHYADLIKQGNDPFNDNQEQN